MGEQWLEVDLNLQPSGSKAQNILLYHHVPHLRSSLPEIFSCLSSAALHIS